MERAIINKYDLNAHYQMKHDLEQIGQASKLEINNLYQFVVFLYGKLKCKKMSIIEKGISSKLTKSETLGKIPSSIRYVDSLTVFDTYINPYKKYEIAEKPKPKPKPKIDKNIDDIKFGTLVSITSYEKKMYDPDNPNYKPQQA